MEGERQLTFLDVDSIEHHMKVGLNLPEEELVVLRDLLKETLDMFSWSYKDLKGIDPTICQHHIDLEPDAKPVRQ